MSAQAAPAKKKRIDWRQRAQVAERHLADMTLVATTFAGDVYQCSKCKRHTMTEGIVCLSCGHDDSKDAK